MSANCTVYDLSVETKSYMIEVPTIEVYSRLITEVGICKDLHPVTNLSSSVLTVSVSA